MYTKDILARLQAGEDIEAIGQEFANALTEAKREFDKKDAVANSKRELAATLVSTLIDYIDLVDPSLNVAEVVDVSDKDLDEIVKMLDKSIPMLSFVIKVETANKDDTTDEEVISNFLNMMKW